MAFGIRTKLLISFGSLTALIAGVGFLGWQNTQHLSVDAKQLYEDQLLGTVSLSNAETSLWKLRYGFPQFIAAPEARKDIREEEPKLYQSIQEEFDNYRKLNLTATEKDKLKKLEEAYKVYIAARPQWFDLIEAGKMEEAREYRAQNTTPLGAETVKLFNEQINLKQDVGAAKYQQILQEADQLTVLIVTTLVIALISASILSLWLGRDITRSLLQSAKGITLTTGGIAATIEEQERIANQQVASVNETTTTIAELEASCNQASEQAQSAAAAAQRALQLTENGTQAVGRTLEEMFMMEKRVGAIAEQIVYLSEQANQIGSISGLVSEIANQTNMLALNSAVEASRAGEYGKGFTIVANEIRKLADQSQQSAEKINLLVAGIQKSINETVMVTDEGTKTVQAGVKVARETEEVFAEVESAANIVVLNNQQVSLNLRQQTDAMRQIVEAMNNINHGAKETATGLTQTKEGTKQLNTAALVLQELV